MVIPAGGMDLMLVKKTLILPNMFSSAHFAAKVFTFLRGWQQHSLFAAKDACGMSVLVRTKHTRRRREIATFTMVFRIVPFVRSGVLRVNQNAGARPLQIGKGSIRNDAKFASGG
jgi:hypothetical protein